LIKKSKRASAANNIYCIVVLILFPTIINTTVYTIIVRASTKGINNKYQLKRSPINKIIGKSNAYRIICTELIKKKKIHQIRRISIERRELINTDEK